MQQIFDGSFDHNEALPFLLRRLIMKLPVVIVAALFSVPALAAGQLNIGAGETFTVSAEQQRMNLDSLVIGDDAVIRLADDVQQWQLRAQRAEIGSNVVIEASGTTGKTGAAGQSVAGQAAECKDGADGGDAGRGGDGENAAAIRLQLGMVSLGSLRILSNGGAGGTGGQGGAGQDAGEFVTTCKSGSEGGDAGRGGDGGNGGNGGDVTVLYWPAVANLSVDNFPNLIEVEAAAGAAGAAGQPGKPGEGSEGRYIQKKTLSGSRSFVGGGETGDKAKAGEAGRPGLAGRVLVEQALLSPQPVAAPVASQAPAATSATKSASSKDAEIKEIKDTLKALMERLDQLEDN